MAESVKREASLAMNEARFAKEKSIYQIITQESA